MAVEIVDVVMLVVVVEVDVVLSWLPFWLSLLFWLLVVVVGLVIRHVITRGPC